MYSPKRYVFVPKDLKIFIYNICYGKLDIS